MKLSVKNKKENGGKYEFINMSDIEFKNSNNEYVDERLSLITIPIKPFSTKSEDLKQLFNYVIDEFVNDTEYFRFDNPHEVFNWEHFWELFKIIHEVFDSRNLLDRLKFSDNNTNFKFKDNFWKYDGFPYMLGYGFSDYTILDFLKYIGDKKFEKHFLCLNRRTKNFREEIVQFLVDSKLDEKSYYSMGSHGNDETHPLFKLLDTEVKILYPHSPMTSNFESDVFCYIITESEFDNTNTTNIVELDSIVNYNDNLYCHLSEKTTRAFIYGLPFVLVSTTDSLKTLKEYGFKTFDRWWDESYDSELDSKLRMKKIQLLLMEISNYSISECQKIYVEMHDVLIHNYNQYLQINKEFEKLNNMDIFETDSFPNEHHFYNLFNKLK